MAGPAVADPNVAEPNVARPNVDYAVAVAGVARALLYRAASDALIGGDAAKLTLRDRSPAATAATRANADATVTRFGNRRLPFDSASFGRRASKFRRLVDS